MSNLGFPVTICLSALAISFALTASPANAEEPADRIVRCDADPRYERHYWYGVNPRLRHYFRSSPNVVAVFISNIDYAAACPQKMIEAEKRPALIGEPAIATPIGSVGAAQDPGKYESADPYFTPRQAIDTVTEQVPGTSHKGAAPCLNCGDTVYESVPRVKARPSERRVIWVPEKHR